MNTARKKIAEIARQNKATIAERDKTIGMIDDMREKLGYDVYLVIRQAAQGYYDHQFNRAEIALMTWETVAQEIEQPAPQPAQADAQVDAQVDAQEARE